MTYQDVLDALDSILEKLRGNNSELCEKLGIEIDDPYINGEEVDSDEIDSEELSSDEGDVEDVDVEIDNVDNADNEQLTDDEDDSSVNEAESKANASKTNASKTNASKTKAPAEPSILRKAADKVSDTWNQTTQWVKDNPGKAVAAAAGTGLATALIGGMMFGDDEEDESTQQSFNESNDDSLEKDIPAETEQIEVDDVITDDDAGKTEEKPEEQKDDAGKTEEKPEEQEISVANIVDYGDNEGTPSGSQSNNDAFGIQKAADKVKSGAITGGALIGAGLLGSALLNRRRRRRRS